MAQNIDYNIILLLKSVEMRIINMKSIILLLFVMNFAVCDVNAQKYRHKSEDEIARMTPAQRVDEWINEQVNHKFDALDNQGEIIRKYVTLDGIKALPRLIEIINQYDPTKVVGGKEKRGERFDAAVLMLGYVDDYGIRLRSSVEGKRAIESLEQAVQRMREAGYGKEDQHDWERHGRFDQSVMQFEYAKGINRKDKDIRSTLKFVYKINLSDDELLYGKAVSRYDKLK